MFKSSASLSTARRNIPNDSKNSSTVYEIVSKVIPWDKEYNVIDSVESYLDNDHHLERLLYERYLLMQNNSDIPEEIAFYKEQAENLKLTLSWRVTKPLRDAKRIFKNLFKGDS